jgi:hypothetical protein
MSEKHDINFNDENLRDVLTKTRFITLSTVCADGSPYATPLSWWAFDERGKVIVFDNRTETTHGKNLARDPRCFITIVNQDQLHGRAVYVKTVAQKLIDNDAIKNAVDLIIARGGKEDGEIWAADFGEIDEAKTRIHYNDDGSLRKFYCYFTAKEEK